MIPWLRTERRNRLFGFALATIVGVSLLSGCASMAGKQPTPEQARQIEQYQEAVQQRLDKICAETGAVGATAAFVLPCGHGGAVASGLADKSAKVPMPPVARMLAGSTGKTFVAAVTLQLLEEGRVDLDAKLSHWLGEETWFPRVPNAADITLKMLLNHTSGIPDHVHTPELIAALKATPEKVWKPEELVALILDKPPLFPAGKGWSYADTNYILTGIVIERVTGRTYYDELTDRILKPRKLTDTIPQRGNPMPGLINGYTTEANPFQISEQVTINGRVAFNPQMEWTGGGVMSTTTDLARWARMLYRGDVLKAETKQLMLDGVETKRWPNTDYGLGVIIRRSEHGLVYGHGGWFPGYITNMSYYPDLDLALAVQFNHDSCIAFDKFNKLLDELAAEYVE